MNKEGERREKEEMTHVVDWMNFNVSNFLNTPCTQGSI